MKTYYRIQSRWPQWAKWRLVTPKPHAERLPFDTLGLRFADVAQAEKALHALEEANAGQFRIVIYDSEPRGESQFAQFLHEQDRGQPLRPDVTLQSDRQCVLCSGCETESAFDYCRACGFVPPVSNETARKYLGG